MTCDQVTAPTPFGETCREAACKVMHDLSAHQGLTHAAKLLYQLEVLLLQKGSKTVCFNSTPSRTPGALCILYLPLWVTGCIITVLLHCMLLRLWLDNELRRELHQLCIDKHSTAPFVVKALHHQMLQ